MQSLEFSRKYRWFVFALLAYAFFYQLAYPIVMGDTDMWYHLNGGRYFWDHFQVPTTTFFSFITPEREWINYFWGFQALIYAIYEVSGYYGLIALRALVFFATLLVIYQYLKKELSGPDHIFYLCLLLVLYFILLDGRNFQVRPHMFSYFFIVFYLFVLEYRKQLAPVLPLTTILWVNLHGVEYVIGALICGAYGLEFLYKHVYRKVSMQREDKVYLASLLGCGLTLFNNPYFFDILKAPFALPQNLELFILELAPLTTAHFTQLIFTELRFSSQTAFALMCFILLIGLLKALLLHKIRLSHLVLSIASVILLLKGTRFIWEFALLNLPLINTVSKSFYVPEFSPATRSRQITRPLLFIILVAIPIASTSQRIENTNRYPFDGAGLPLGTTEFLRHTGATGNLLISPSFAGYSQWQLYPQILVYMDMEFPPFNDLDYFRAAQAYSTTRGLEQITTTYPIDFISVPVSAEKFKTEVDKQNQWAPVFFDDNQVLYANRKRQQPLIDAWELQTNNAHKLDSDKEHPEQQEQELRRILKVHTRGERASLTLYKILFDQQRYADALQLAQQYHALRPDSANGLFMIGNVYENTEHCEEAINYFKQALSLADNEFQATLHKHLGSCYYILKDFNQAYVHHAQALNPFKKIEAIEDLYQYAFSAYILNKKQHATTLLTMILLQANEESDTNTVERSQSLLAQIEQERNESQPGLFSWLAHLTGLGPKR